MKKFFLPLTLLATLVVIFGGIFLSSRKPPPTPTPLPLPSNYEYFWGDGCPHCAKVEEFFKSWDKAGEVQIDKKEVWKDKQNADLMLKRANYCAIRPSEAGVPFLFTPDGKCIIGDEPIIDYFKNLEL